MIGKVVEIGNFSIVVVADNQSPSILNPDFLKYNHIVPADWELAMPPICSPQVSQVIFKNGVNIIAQSDKVTFWEALEPDRLSIKLPEVSFKYVEAIPYIGYRAVGINLTGHVLVGEEKDPGNFVLDKLIVQGNWKNFRGKSPDVEVKFVYPIENGALTVEIASGMIEESEDESLPIVLFGANFHREIPGSSHEERTEKVKEIIQSWEADFNTFKSLVEEVFLSDNEGKQL